MPTLGTIYNATVGTAGNLTTGSDYAVITLSPGIYITTCSFPFDFTGTYVASYSAINLLSGTATLPASSGFFLTGGLANAGTFLISGTFFVSVTATAVIKANVNFIGASSVTQGTIGTYWQAIRIG